MNLHLGPYSKGLWARVQHPLYPIKQVQNKPLKRLITTLAASTVLPLDPIYTVNTRLFSTSNSSYNGSLGVQDWEAK